MTRPTLDNWLTAEHLHWSLRHVREMLPTARIRRGQQTVELIAAHDSSLRQLEFRGTHHSFVLESWLESTNVDSLTVLRGNSSLLEWRAPDVRDDDVHLLFSVTKSVTSLLVGVLVGRGLIEIDAPVTHYVPEVIGSGFDGATVRNLLDMTTAFAFVEDYNPGEDLRAYRNAAGWYPSEPQSPNLHEFIATREADGAHGQRFRYQSPATDLVGWICESVTNQAFATALSENVWAPMGAEADADIAVDRQGTPRNAGGMSTTPRDLARLGLLVADGGRGIIPIDYINDLTRNGSTQQWADGDFAPWLPGGAYRSCWYQPRVDPDVVMGVGIHGQMLYVDRARRVVVAKQSSWTFADDTDAHNDSYLACQAIARAVG